MRRTAFTALTLFAALAQPAALAAQTAAVPQIHSTDPDRLVKDGQVFFPLGFYGASITMATGDSQWLGQSVAGDCPCDFDPSTPKTCDLHPAEVAFHAFADRLAAQGLNYFRAWINWGAIPVGPAPGDWDYHMLHPYRRSSTGGAVDGGAKFDLDQPNACYYDLLDRQIAYAAQKGLVAQLALFDCWHVAPPASAPPGFPGRDYFKAQNNVNGVNWTSSSQWLSTSGAVANRQKAFVQQVMAAIGDRPNIVWETCNEDLSKNVSTPATAITAWDQMIATEIAAHDPLGHLVMPLDLPEHRTVAGHTVPTQSQSASQASAAIAAMHNTLRDTQHAWNLPLITDNDCCGARTNYGSIPREKAWAALTAGAHTDFFVDNVAVTHGLMNRADVTTGMREVGYVGKFLRDLGVNLVGMVPSDSLVTGGTGAWAYARSGQEFVVYLRTPASGNPSVTLSSLPASRTARWFNPRTGANQNATGGPSYTAPATGDWVLHVKAVAQPLAITQHPASQTVPSGGVATFQVAAGGGTAPYAYRWQYGATGGSYADLNNGGGISGATTATLTVNPVTSARAGFYRARVTDSASPAAQVTSNAAQLSLSGAACTPSSTALCLRNNRFRVQATFVHNGSTLTAQAFPQSQGTGFFWFFGGSNLEVGVKILQGPTAWWIFHGAATDLAYTLTVTDTQTGAQRVYNRPAGTLCGGTDFNAFPLGSLLLAGLPEDDGDLEAGGEPLPRAVCTPSGTRICQQSNRFQVEILRGGTPQPAVALTSETGMFWFFSSDNGEVFVKVLDGRGLNNHFWVYYGSMSDQAYTIVVTDTQTGAVRQYVNPLGTYCGGADTQAFPG